MEISGNLKLLDYHSSCAHNHYTATFNSLMMYTMCCNWYNQPVVSHCIGKCRLFEAALQQC